jgi:hypothetical protein
MSILPPSMRTRSIRGRRRGLRPEARQVGHLPAGHQEPDPGFVDLDPGHDDVPPEERRGRQLERRGRDAHERLRPGAGHGEVRDPEGRGHEAVIDLAEAEIETELLARKADELLARPIPGPVGPGEQDHGPGHDEPERPSASERPPDDSPEPPHRHRRYRTRFRTAASENVLWSRGAGPCIVASSWRSEWTT